MCTIATLVAALPLKSTIKMVNQHGLKLATSTFVQSIFDVDLDSHIPQVLPFYYILHSFGESKPVCLLCHADEAWESRNSCPWLPAFRLTILMIDLMDKAPYQRGHSAHYCGFKLATSTFVQSIFDIDLYCNILQALRF